MKRILFVLLAALAIIACKKDELSKTELLTKGPWTQTAEKYNPPVPVQIGDSITFTTVYVADFFEILYDCAKDDQLSFQANGLYKWETGPTVCDNNGNGVSTESTVYDQGSWVFNTSETKITLSDGYYSYDYTIEELTENKLVLSSSLMDTADNEYIQTSEYIR